MRASVASISSNIFFNRGECNAFCLAEDLVVTDDYITLRLREEKGHKTLRSGIRNTRQIACSDLPRKKERKKSLTRGHVKDLGSAGGIQSYRGQRYEEAIGGKCFYDFPVPPSLCDGCALRGACRARPMRVCGGPMLMGGMLMRWGWDRVCSATIPSR